MGERRENMLEGKTKEESVRAFMWTLLLISFGAFVYSYRGILENYNSTVLAFTYRYGFISRGLIGSLYHLLDAVLPMDLISYESALYTSLVVTLLIFAIFLCLCYRMLQRCPEKYMTIVETICILFMITVITTFSSRRNLGRLDIYMILLSLWAVWIIIEGKHLWLVVPLSCLGVMVHQGYVFMYFNMILVLLFYQCLTRDKKKYLRLLVLSLLGVSALFLWFQFFSHIHGESIVDGIIEEASILSRGGKYHETLIEAEILGKDLTREEWPMHVENWMELPIFLLFVSPYIALGIAYFKTLLKKCSTMTEKVKYWVVCLGAVTLLPNFILKVDYARWFLAMVVYYLVVWMALILLGDLLVQETLFDYVNSVKRRCSGAFLLLLYPVLFLPFWDVHICELLKNISNPINESILHLW